MKNKIFINVAIVGAILIVVNILSDMFFFRLDLSDDKRYTLSKATKEILKNLPQTATVKAYFSEELPPQIVNVRRDFEDLLTEYSALSDGNLVYEFIAPDKDEETERKAQEAGIQPIVINVAGDDKVQQMKAYMGVVIEMGEESEVIPVLQPNGSMEYDLSSNLKKMSVSEKPAIGVLQGHGEPSIYSMGQVMQQLSVLYNVEQVYQNDTVNALLKYKTLAIVAPKDSFPEGHFRQLDEFLANGGSLFVALNRAEGKLQEYPPMAVEITTGFETWLSKKGIQVSADLLLDVSCGSIGVQQQGFPFPIQVQFPYFPGVTQFADHPVTKGLEAVMLQFASSVRYTGDSAVKFTALATSTDKAATAALPVYFDINKKWTETDFPQQNIPVVGLFEGKFGGSHTSRIIVVGDGDFPVNGDPQQRQQQQQLQPDNVNLMANAIDWMSDDTGLIDLRSKGVSARPIDQLEDSTKALLKWTNFLLPIIVIVVYGIIRIQMRRIQRIKRTQQGYV